MIIGQLLSRSVTKGVVSEQPYSKIIICLTPLLRTMAYSFFIVGCVFVVVLLIIVH